MPADAVNYGKLACELNDALSDGRIDKIIMSGSTTLALGIRARGKNNTLLITAATSPRCFLTDKRLKSTDVPLSFCLHLRRHIGGGGISRIYALPFERILGVDIISRGDLGEPRRYTLYIEIMGKYSNVVLTDENGKITDALKHVGYEESRPVMPGLTFVPPRDETRFDPSDERADALASSCPSDELPSVMVKRLRGLSSVTAAEIAHIAAQGGMTLSAACKALTDKPISPVVYYLGGKATDFSFCDYESVKGERRAFPTLSAAMDEYYASAGIADEKTAVLSAVSRALGSALTKQRKKLALFERDIAAASDYEHERILGELITANLYSVKPGDKELVADNWYDGKRVTIKLTENTPQEDAQKHFARYRKKKRTVDNLALQKAETERAIDYLESVEVSLQSASDVADAEDIEEELEQQGYIRHNGKRGKKAVSEPHKYEAEGFTVLIGKSNVQNDRLTKEARGDDMWLHTQGFHGSHVIIVTRGKTVPRSVLEKAASAAAFFSKARLSENVPVDYTFVRDVHKKRGAAPGKVDYFGAKTLYVDPISPDTLFGAKK